MEDDLKYPPHLIASPHKELPMSLLRSGVGSMPGVPQTPVIENGLKAGLGVIPGSLGEQTFGQVVSRKYPDYDTYRGEAHRGVIQFHSIRLELLNDWIQKVATNYVERTVAKNGGRMLSLDIWVSEDKWKILNTYRWSIVFNFYIPEGTRVGVATAAIPALVLAGIIALLLIIALIFLVRSMERIVWGPPDREGILPSLTTLAMIGGGIFIAAMIIKKPKRKKKK